MGCIMTGFVSAEEQKSPPDISGRWVVTRLKGVLPKKGTIFDFNRCGEKWCGVKVGKDGKCGRIAFRFSEVKRPDPTLDSSYNFRGTYVALENFKPFTLFVTAKTGVIAAGGYIGDVNPFTRAFPLTFVMKYKGNAKCKAETS
jgi:hypothetical protein